MAGSAAKAELAAEALEAFLRDQPGAGDAGAGPGPIAPREQDAGSVPPAGPGSAVRAEAANPPLRLAHTDWLRHRLTVTGPASAVDAFGRAASGAGTIPWRLDLDSLEEDWFHLLINPANRTLSLAGARVLAGQLRDAVEHRHAVAVSHVGRSQACPFDLHALVPVPADILALGPDHPAALDWLWRHWGTTYALRHVATDRALAKGASLPAPAAGEAWLRLRFWSADWTPWRAFARIRAAWPGLRFDVQPDYTAG